MRQLPSYFDAKQPVLVYIARRLREALKLEKIFTEAGVDYGVEADHYYGGFVFKTQRVGAFFYVLPQTVEMARRIMQENRYKPYEGEQPGDEPPQL